MAQLALYKGKLSSGKTQWSPYGITSDINVEDVSVQTQSLVTKIPIGIKPTIMLFGVKGKDGRVATLSGSIKGASLRYQDPTGTGMDVVNISDGLNGVDMVVCGMAIKVVGDGLPELADALWTIDNITWDRQASQLGMYKFKLQLGYVWNHQNEIQLYAEDVGLNLLTSAKFYVVGKAGKDGTYYIESPKVKTTIHDLNTATFNMPTDTFEKGNAIQIFCETDTTNPVFFGIITDKRSNSGGSITYSCKEIGELLYRKSLAKFGNGIFKPRIRIPNPYKKTQLKLLQIVGTILKFYNDAPIFEYNLIFKPGYGIDKTGTWGNQNYLPGRDKSNFIPAQILSGYTVGKALDNVLNEQCGLHTWFDNLTGALEYGFYRNKVTIDPTTDYIMFSEQKDSLAEEYEADCVEVIDSSANNPTIYPRNMNGSVIKYKFDSDLTNEQLDTIAQRIYADMKTNRDTFAVRFPPGTVKFRDGDVFTGLGDATVSPVMTFRGGTDFDDDPTKDPSDSCWQIREMIITDTYTECIVGSTYYSIFDIYRTALTRYDGCPAPTDTKDIETCEVALPAAAQASDKPSSSIPPEGVISPWD